MSVTPDPALDTDPASSAQTHDEPPFDDRSLACAVAVLALGRESVEEIATVSDEELVALDGVGRQQITALPYLEEHAPEAEDRIPLALTAMRSLMVRRLVVGEIAAAEFEERPLADENLQKVTVEPRLTGALVLRRSSRALLAFERETAMGMHRLYYYPHDSDVILEEEVTADGVHVFCVMPASAVPERARHLIDQPGVAGEGGEPRSLALEDIENDDHLAPQLESTLALTVGTMLSRVVDAAMGVHFHMTDAAVIAGQPSADGTAVTFMEVSAATIEQLVADMLQAAADIDPEDINPEDISPEDTSAADATDDGDAEAVTAPLDLAAEAQRS